MPIHFSTDLINALLGGNSDLRDLEKYYQRYMTGDKTALMSVFNYMRSITSSYSRLGCG